MSVKRPLLDLSALTAEHAAPMAEGMQRGARPSSQGEASTQAHASRIPAVTQNLEALAFKVSPSFRRRFRGRAAAADLKLNELLFEALDAWEEKQGMKS